MKIKTNEGFQMERDESVERSAKTACETFHYLARLTKQ